MRITRDVTHLVVASLIGAVASEALAFVRVQTNDGFGRGDLIGFLYWNLLFAIYLFAIAWILRPRLTIVRRMPRLLSWTIVGACAGFLWTWIVAAALGPWIQTFSFPVLYIWTVAGAVFGLIVGGRPSLGLSVRSRPWLVLLVPPAALVTVIALNVGLLLGSRYLWGRAQPEVFTFPDQFIGQVYIVRDSVRGQTVPTEGRARKYNIPPSGIFVTSSRPVDGWLHQAFFYRQSDGSTTPINARWDATIDDTPENRADTTVGVYFLHSGTRTENHCSVEYTSFSVGRKADILAERGVDSLESYLAQRCVLGAER